MIQVRIVDILELVCNVRSLLTYRVLVGCCYIVLGTASPYLDVVIAGSAVAFRFSVSQVIPMLRSTHSDVYHLLTSLYLACYIRNNVFILLGLGLSLLGTAFFFSLAQLFTRGAQPLLA